MGDHPLKHGIVRGKARARRIDILGGDGLDDFVVIAPGCERRRIFEIGKSGHLVVSGPEDIDERAQHLIVLAAEE